jgi:hypothetical protein
VQIDRDHVVQVLRAGGRRDEAERAERELDVLVDTVRDADLLRGARAGPGQPRAGRRARPALTEDETTVAASTGEEARRTGDER